MAPTDTTWTEDAIARLRRLRDEGHPAAEIGRRPRSAPWASSAGFPSAGWLRHPIAAPQTDRESDGVSKDAVVGKAHRLALPPRPSPIQAQ